MFAFNGAESQAYFVGAEANLTANITPMARSKDEQPFKIDFGRIILQILKG